MRPEYATRPCLHGLGQPQPVNSSAHFFIKPPGIESMMITRLLDQVLWLIYDSLHVPIKSVITAASQCS